MFYLPGSGVREDPLCSGPQIVGLPVPAYACVISVLILELFSASDLKLWLELLGCCVVHGGLPVYFCCYCLH